MSINWVTLEDSGPSGRKIVPLPDEAFMAEYDGVALGLVCDGRGGRSWTCTNGRLYLSNFRLVYLAKRPSDDFESFNLPLPNFVDSKLNQPFFGPNSYTGQVLPVPEGGIPGPANLTLTFNSGGAYELADKFRNLRSLLHNVDGQASLVQTLDPLPRYTRSPAASTTLASPADGSASTIIAPEPLRASQEPVQVEISAAEASRAGEAPEQGDTSCAMPPAYEEATNADSGRV